MAATLPFTPDVKKGSGGLTVVLSIKATTQNTASITSAFSPTLQVVSFPVAGSVVPLYLRISGEAAPVASNTDTPLVATTQQQYVRLFANPVPNGTCNIAVVCTVAPTTGGLLVFITPGEGGV